MPAAQQTTEVSAPTSFGDNRGIKFQIKTGNARWECVLQDRGHFERTRVSRQNSTDSVSSTASSSSLSSSH